MNLCLRGISLAILCHFGFAQIPEGTPCYTSRGEYGLCTNIRSCDYMIYLLRTKSKDQDTIQYLKTSVCGYIGKTPMVCCPTNIDNNDLNDGLSERMMNENQNGRNSISPEDTELNGPQCGISNFTNYRVVGGFPAKLYEIPFIAVLGYRNARSPNTPKWLCGGSLITRIHVLTAAHCIRDDLYVVRLGDLDLFNDNDGASPEDIGVVKKKVHEEYSPTKFTSDIALITLERAPKNPNVYPVCLPTREPLRNNKFVKYQAMVAGWGALHFNGPSSAALQLAQIPVVDQAKCMKAFEGKSVIDEKILCAGKADGKQDACQGDSGGPLFWGTVDGELIRYYQIGVVSYGFRCAEVGYPGVYTRITHFADWIENNVK